MTVLGSEVVIERLEDKCRALLINIMDVKRPVGAADEVCCQQIYTQCKPHYLNIPEILRILQLGLQSVMSVYHRHENDISTILEFCAAKIPKERRSQGVPIL